MLMMSLGIWEKMMKTKIIFVHWIICLLSKLPLNSWRKWKPTQNLEPKVLPHFYSWNGFKICVAHTIWPAVSKKLVHVYPCANFLKAQHFFLTPFIPRFHLLHIFLTETKDKSPLLEFFCWDIVSIHGSRIDIPIYSRNLSFILLEEFTSPTFLWIRFLPKFPQKHCSSKLFAKLML